MKKLILLMLFGITSSANALQVGDITVTGKVSTDKMEVGTMTNIQALVFLDGSTQTTASGDNALNVTSSTQTKTGGLTLGGNLTATKLIGDGSQITGLEFAAGQVIKTYVDNQSVVAISSMNFPSSDFIRESVGSSITIRTVNKTKSGAYGNLFWLGSSSNLVSNNSGSFDVLTATNITVANSVGMNVSGTSVSVRISSAGFYYFSASFSFEGSANSVVEFKTFVNGLPGNIGLQRKISTGGDVGSADVTGAAFLNGGDVVDFRYTMDGAGDFIRIRQASFTAFLVSQQ